MIGIGTNRQSKSCDTLYTSPSTSDNSGIMANALNRNLSQTNSKSILLNPGPDYLIEPQDQCFYISQVKEENYNWKIAKSKICN